MKLPDAHRILGLSPDATPGQVRRAYRQAVLRHHPDTLRDGADGGSVAFHQLTDAYQQIMRRLGEPGPARQAGPVPPEELARRQGDWLSSHDGVRMEASFSAEPTPGAVKKVWATINEPRVFVLSWLAAVAVSVAALGAMAWLLGPREISPSRWTMAAVFALPFALYAGVLVGAVVAVYSTRKVYWLALQIRRLRRSLPTPPPQLRGRP